MGGSTEFANQTVEQYGTVAMPDRIPNRAGYTFLSYDNGDETILYGNSIKYKDVLDLYEYIPDEDGYMFFGKYISQAYAHNPNMVRWLYE